MGDSKRKVRVAFCRQKFSLGEFPTGLASKVWAVHKARVGTTRAGETRRCSTLVASPRCAPGLHCRNSQALTNGCKCHRNWGLGRGGAGVAVKYPETHLGCRRRRRDAGLPSYATSSRRQERTGAQAGWREANLRGRD